MKITRRVKEILANYESDTPGTKGNLARILMEGRLGGTGKLIILPVDQGFEHGPARSFAPNPAGYDPHYHYQMAIDAGLNAYAAPLRRPARPARSRRRYLRRRHPDHPEDEQRQQPVPSEGRRRSGRDIQRQGRPAPGLRRDRLHDLSRLRRHVRPVRGNPGAE